MGGFRSPIGTPPANVPGVLLGTPGTLAGGVPIGAWSSGDGSVVVSLASEGSGLAEQRLEFDALGRVRSAQRFDQNGVTIWSARFDDYREVDDQFFAFRVELEFPRVEASAKIVFKHVELNPALRAELFVLTLPSGPR